MSDSARPVVSVDVDDAEFVRFKGLYDRWVASTKEMPSDGWNQLGDRLDDILLQLMLMDKASDKVDVHAKRSATSAGVWAKASKETAKYWTGVAKDAERFTTHITSATKSILRWTAITSAVSGLLGGGGLFGIERLAREGDVGRRTSLGRGTSFGGSNAFELNYGRVLANPQGFIGGVNEAMNDATKRQGLIASGVDAHEGRDTADVADDLIQRIGQVLDQTRGVPIAQTMKGYGFDQFMSNEDAQAIRDTPQEERRGYSRSYRADKPKLDLTGGELKGWQDLDVQFHRAADTLNVTIMRDLVPLAGPIGEVSEGFTAAVDAFLKSEQVKDAITWLGVELKELAAYLKSDQFKQDVQTFEENVVALGKAAGEALKFLGIVPRTPEEHAAGDTQYDKDKATPGTRAYSYDHAGGTPGWIYADGAWRWSGESNPDPRTPEKFAKPPVPHDFDPTADASAPVPTAPAMPRLGTPPPEQEEPDFAGIGRRPDEVHGASKHPVYDAVTGTTGQEPPPGKYSGDIHDPRSFGGQPRESHTSVLDPVYWLKRIDAWEHQQVQIQKEARENAAKERQAAAPPEPRTPEEKAKAEDESGPSTFGNWLRSIFGVGGAEAAPATGFEAHPDDPKMTAPPVPHDSLMDRARRYFAPGAGAAPSGGDGGGGGEGSLERGPLSPEDAARWNSMTDAEKDAAAARTNKGGGGDAPSGSLAEIMSRSEREAGLPEGLLEKVRWQESRDGRNVGPSSAGALGEFQFMPETGKHYGLMTKEDLLDPKKEAVAAAKLLGERYKARDGDVDKTLSDYNAGPGVTDFTVYEASRHPGTDWKQYLSQETRDYIRDIRAAMAQTRNPSGGQQQSMEVRGPRAVVAVNVYNQTGGNAIVQAAQVAG